MSWQAGNPDRRAAALILEVKGDFCHDIRAMLAELGRGDDYIELYRVLPDPDDGVGWVTLRDVYHCAIDKTLFNEKSRKRRSSPRAAVRRG